jgi:hypothetical protein
LSPGEILQVDLEPNVKGRLIHIGDQQVRLGRDDQHDLID